MDKKESIVLEVQDIYMASELIFNHNTNMNNIKKEELEDGKVSS